MTKQEVLDAIDCINCYQYDEMCNTERYYLCRPSCNDCVGFDKAKIILCDFVGLMIDHLKEEEDEEPEEPEDNELAPCPKCGKETLKCVAFLDGAFTSGMLIRCDSCGHQFPHQTPREYIDYCLWDDDPSVEKYNNYMREHFPEMVMKVEKLSDHLEVIGKDDKAEKSSCEEKDTATPKA